MKETVTYPMQAVTLNPADPRWLDFISTRPDTHIFHHPAWMKVISECYGYRAFIFALCDQSDQLLAGIPIMETNALWTGRKWISLPFSDHCKPVSENPETLASLLELITLEFQNLAIPSLEIRWQVPATQPFKTNLQHVLSRLTLEEDPMKMLEQFHHNHRRNIRTAQKREIYITKSNSRADLKAFYRLHTYTRQRQGIPVQPWRFFELLGKYVIEPGLGYILLAYHRDTCIASAIFLHWQKTLVYKYGASRHDALSLRPNNLLFWHVIESACQNGFESLGLGRTHVGNLGLRDFKSRWGADEFPLAYSNIETKSSKNLVDKILPVGKFLIRNAPAWVCRASGELFYKQFA